MGGGQQTPVTVNYAKLEPNVAAVQAALAAMRGLQDKVSARWMAMKLLEGDVDAEKILGTLVEDPRSAHSSHAYLETPNE
jgi:hypothetical protein